MLGLAIALSGCELFVGRAQAPVSPAPVVAVPDDDDHLEWAKNEEYFVVVRKTCRTLDVYRYGERVQSYPAVFGLGGNSASKLYEGDLRTPSGLYKTIRYEVYLFNNVLYRRPAHLHVWVSDDRRKLPVQIRVRMTFTIGTINFQLEKHE